tara:strand:- start:17002 stop:19359 length:2358 start_codon:yes stop_codon:yes gene_type:complete
MSDKNNDLDRLQQKLNSFMNRQEALQSEVELLRVELRALKLKESFKTKNNPTEGKTSNILEEIAIELDKKTSIKAELPNENISNPPVYSDKPDEILEKRQAPAFNLEKIIGENIINKIGILITVIGVGIGANYAIENNLISPLTRIILGYVIGFVLLLFGFKLKEKYLSFSAVLVSGAMASLYLVTFAAYSLYALIPQSLAFILMVIFTAFTVFAAIKYNKEVIAIFGLVGAYAVPFLLSNDSGEAIILLSYIGLANIGILIIALQRYWKLLYYSAFVFTWLIVFSWILSSYSSSEDLILALSFISLYYLTFYATFLGYKLLKSEPFSKGDIAMILMNSSLFFGLGYLLLFEHETGEAFQGVFTFVNALIHFLVSIVVYKKHLQSRELQNFVSGLVLVFLTLTVPVQLDGSWVSIIWVLEATLLFWIGRSKLSSVYEKLSYPLMFLASASLLDDWSTGYYVFSENQTLPIWNTTFLTSMLFVAGFSAIFYTNKKWTESSYLNPNSTFFNFINKAIPAVLLLALYNGLRLEIVYYFDLISYTTRIAEENGYGLISDHAISSFSFIWQICYTFVFLSIFNFINFTKVKDPNVGKVALVLSTLSVFIFCGVGIFELKDLRELYIASSPESIFEQNSFNLIIRYICFGLGGILLFSMKKVVDKLFSDNLIFKIYDGVLHFTLIWILSAELIHWLDLSGSQNTYKLGLSILWGVYALMLIVLGIIKKAPHLRIGAISIFGVTLLKLFLYDVSELSTISKTILFVALGVLLLIISFLYNKYKTSIFGEDEE